MIVRLAVAVLLAGALLGVGLPAAETARTERAATLTQNELIEFRETTARFRTHNDATRPERPGAVRIHRLRVPAGTTIRLGVGPHNESLRWKHDARRGRVETDLPFARSVRLTAGSHRLRLGLVRVDGKVRIRLRTFKSDAGTTG
ncbi:DUF7311 family protein [Halosegnis longus]|uniref:DUF7311 domain-containing protein n=1 Tax=Halosegnis longus TaxID=2216012 RepID=A0AAJ4UWE1_9EURY|nr:hypothetical protein [Halosegnis longus]RNJ26993.1 hypothetical protein Nmn1133_10055 [Salella cibi]